MLSVNKHTEHLGNALWQLEQVVGWVQTQTNVQRILLVKKKGKFTFHFACSAKPSSSGTTGLLQ